MYEYSKISFCPWCGRKLEKPKEQKPKEQKPVGITKEQYDKLARWVAEEHYRINGICTALDTFLDSPAVWGLGRAGMEQLQKSLQEIRDHKGSIGN